MNWLGGGGSKNLFLGYVWVSVASRLAEEKNERLTDPSVFSKMEPFLTSEQIYRAKQLATEWTLGDMFIEN